MKNTISILAENKADAIKAINKFLKRTEKKFGSDCFSYTFGNEYDTKINNRNVMYVDFTYEVKIPEIKFGEYEYAATLKIESTGNLVYPTDSYKDVDFSEYFDSHLGCDHCHTKRKRKEVHLFIDPKTGDRKTIAKSCAKEYFGVDIDIQIKSIINYFTKDNVKFISSFSYGEEHYPVNTFITYVYSAIKLYGYKSKANSDYPTSDFCAKIADGTNQYMDIDEIEYIRSIAEKLSNKAEADNFDVKEVYEFWDNLDAKGNTFLHNCKVELHKLNPSQGMLAYAVQHMLKTKEEEIRKQEEAKTTLNEWIGNVGDKVELTATVKKTKIIGTQYGASNIVTFKDDKGRTIIFFDNKCRDYNEGDTYTFKCKIKSHTEFDKVKQTNVNYVKFI